MYKFVTLRMFVKFMKNLPIKTNFRNLCHEDGSFLIYIYIYIYFPFSTKKMFSESSKTHEKKFNKWGTISIFYFKFVRIFFTCVSKDSKKNIFFFLYFFFRINKILQIWRMKLLDEKISNCPRNLITQFCSTKLIKKSGNHLCIRFIILHIFLDQKHNLATLRGSV